DLGVAISSSEITDDTIDVVDSKQDNTLAGDPERAALYRILTRLSLRYAQLDRGARESLEQALQPEPG
ncbi:MAG: hypothetical protein IIA60_09520, partial [Candidatus Marinimicrobia bacterium]|nr:hypothetical protein [Candidatus Neomarinimicrobiota bacterium]